MKIHSNDFKNKIKENGRQIDVKINYNDEFIDGNVINMFKPHTNTTLFKTIMKEFTFDSNIKIPSKIWVKPEFGVKINSDYEYLEYDNYYINEEPEYSADNRAYTHKSYDSMIESMIKFDEYPIEITYPITYKNMLVELATTLGWTFTQADFPNENTMIEYDLYSGLDLTYRDILDDLCPASMGNIVVTDDKEMKIIFPTETGETIDEEFLKDINVNVSKKVGPINALVLSRAEDGDTINRRDEDSIIENELHEIKIKDNLLLSSSFRENFIDEMFDKIKGLEYYTIDVTSTGVAFFDALDIFNLSIYGINYKVMLLNTELNVESGLSEQLLTLDLEESVTDYSTSSQTDKAKKMATIIAYKNQAKIELVAEQTDNNSSQITSLELTTDNISSNISRVDDLATEVSSMKQTTDELNLTFKENSKNPNLMANSSGFFGTQGVHNPFTKFMVKINATNWGAYNPNTDLDYNQLLEKDSYIKNLYICSSSSKEGFIWVWESRSGNYEWILKYYVSTDGTISIADEK